MKMRYLKSTLITLCTFFCFIFTTNGQSLFQHKEHLSGFGNLMNNNGVAVADYDGDLDLDVFVVALNIDNQNEAKTLSKLYRNNNNGTFTDVTDSSGLLNQLINSELDPSYTDFVGLDGVKFGAYWGDYNNDGYPDIFFTYLSKVQLFKNNTDGTFTDVTTESGITKVNDCENTGATWFDYDNDGYLDLYVVDWKRCNTNTLYKNNGDGTFTDVTTSSNIKTESEASGYVAIPFDFNKDGWMDLYVSNDLNLPNDLFINNNGVFSEQASLYGLASANDDMGITIGDYNADNEFDFFITAIDKNVLFSNNGNQTFSEVAATYALDNDGWAWGTKFADFDLDGDDDLLVVNGFNLGGRKAEMNRYYENTSASGTVSFSNANNQGLGEETISVEAIDFDYDFDGDLDVFVTNSDRNSFFYENLTNNYTTNNKSWFQVMLQGTVSNRNAVGTVITLTTPEKVYKKHYSGVGFLGQSIKPVHFGINASTTIQELKIEWPSGEVDTYQNLQVNQFIKAIENNGYQSLNIQPSNKLSGCTNPNACNYNANAVTDDGSCAFLDVGNATISGANVTSYFKTETYTYNSTIDAPISWAVQGGDIISGMGTKTVQVRWGFHESGVISATANEASCDSEEISLNVSLNTQSLPNDISVARLWNEALLEAIRDDYARPTVHARNLFHTSIAMYDAWAAYSEGGNMYLLGNTVNGFTSSLNNFKVNEDVASSRNKALSYAVYRLLSHRFKDSPGATESQNRFDLLMSQLGYDKNFTSVAYEDGDAAALGNYIAQTVINYGNQDGSRESSSYDNAYYQTINDPMVPNLPGNPNITDPNRWQSLSLDVYIDQSGNLISEGVPIEFLSPEWGDVWGFALKDEDKTQYVRDGHTYSVFNDPLSPPYISDSNQQTTDWYQWGFSLVSVWGAHLDPKDGVMWDISPKGIGNIDISSFPTSFANYSSFYNLLDGGDIGTGRTTNPITSQPYEEQMVPRGDYARVLAEFWADGPDSETPPGHWFTILNYVHDHSDFERKFEGTGEVIETLEWDVKAYFALAGAMHDAAISACSIKGWYDYLRPISAIRYMASKGQSTNESLSNYHKHGLPLINGYIEVVEEGDDLAGAGDIHVGKIKVKSWKGHSFISNPAIDEAGVGWILAEKWWPYQRPSFVTPPFAGYVSGHSTFSRAAAEVLTLLTGSEYFPGGMGEFVAKKNEFLVFEEGPSVDVVLQWATYRDASDQCSLSRIWGGIHPPADDIPGRLIGENVGKEAFAYAKAIFEGSSLSQNSYNISNGIYPNPVEKEGKITIENTNSFSNFELYDIRGKAITITKRFESSSKRTVISIGKLASGVYILSNREGMTWKIVVN